ncbi:MAG: methyltransferase domain-containing protein [Gemmataceae bacterium]
MVWLSRRDRRPEVMDQPGLDPARHRQALAALRRINRLSRSAAALFGPLAGLHADLATAKLRVLDVASGGGDVAVRLWKRAARAGLDWRVTGIDVSPVAVEHARRHALGEGAPVRFTTLDALRQPIEGDFDAVVCSLFLHHLDEDDAVALLQVLARVGEGGPRLVLVHDLDRSLLGLWAAVAVGRLLTTSPVVRTDGPRSVRPPSRLPRCWPWRDGPGWWERRCAHLAVALAADLEAAVTIAPTLTLAAAAQRPWPVVVLGAGPAGALAAHQLARRGVGVLLVDQASFPRPKVCGSCLNGAALAALADAGLDDLPARLGAVPLRAISLRAGGRAATLPLSGVAVSREAFDAALVREATRAGAHFLPLTRAAILPETGRGELRSVTLRQAGAQASVATSVILAASGLGGAPTRVLPGSRIGLGAVVETGDPFYRRGEVVMCCGGGGYAGLVRLEDGRLDVACAADVGEVRRAGGPAGLVGRLLRDNRCPVPDALHSAGWRGTPPLTRRAIGLAPHRLLALGDAAGYVEPFTGEGIAWALASAVAVADLAAAWGPAVAAEWRRRHRRLVLDRQRVCRAAAAVLRRPALAAVTVAALAWLPALAGPVLRRLNQPPRGVR